MNKFRIRFNMNNKNSNLDLSIISSIIFILASLISLLLIFDEKGRINDSNYFFNKKDALNISFYNRIVFLIAILISFYVGYSNLKNEDDNTLGKYKSSLLFTTNILTLISAILILYVSYLNKEEQSLNISDIENPLI